MLFRRKMVVLGLLLLGCVGQTGRAGPDDAPRIRLEVRRAESKPARDLEEARVQGTGTKVYLHREAEITDQDIAGARVILDERTEPAIEVRFTEGGRKKMARLSERQLQKPLAVLVNGKVMCAPVVKAKFSERALITGRFTRAEAERIAAGINGK